MLARETAPSRLPTIAQIAKQDYQVHADEDSEDELSIQQPTTSLLVNKNGNDEDSFDVPSPRLSIPIGEEEQTMRSVEMARRATGQGFAQGGIEDAMLDDVLTGATPNGLSNGSRSRLDNSNVSLNENERVDDGSFLWDQVDQE